MPNPERNTAQNAPDDMSTTPDHWFAVGRHLVEEERFAEALPAFEKALGAVADEPRYLSFYGLCLTKTRRDPVKGKTLCEAAVRKEFYRTELLANLATVLLAQGNRKRAVGILHRGLRLDRENRQLNQLLQQVGLRKTPILPFFERNHLLNRLAGKLRHSLFGPRDAVPAGRAA
jgi:cytochrome c-type biogenesis protein CcmH/NrfG